MAVGCAVSVEVVRGARWEAFFALHPSLYREAPCAITEDPAELRALLSAENPFFARVAAPGLLPLLATRAGEPAARLVGFVDEAAGRAEGVRCASFGLFEARPDPEAVAALFEALRDQARRLGCTHLRGPQAPGGNDEAGLLVDGFATPPVFGMPYHLPGYARLLTGAGLRPEIELLGYRIPTAAPPVGPLPPGVALRSFDPARFDAELALVGRLYNGCFADHWGHPPLSLDELRWLAEALGPVFVPALLVIATVDGRPAGFALALPDRARRGETQARFDLCGVLPEQRGRGLSGLLVRAVLARLRAAGIPSAGFVALAGNRPIERVAAGLGARVCKRFQVFGQDLAEGAAPSAGRKQAGRQALVPVEHRGARAPRGPARGVP